MSPRLFLRSAFLTLTVVCSCSIQTSNAQLKSGESDPAAETKEKFPAPESLSYRVEWRMITAGTAKVKIDRDQQNWQINLDLESAGLVSRLFRIEDKYKALVTDQFCGINSTFEAQEGKRHVIETELIDGARRKAIFDLHDLTKNAKQHAEIDVAPCTHDIVGALVALRSLRIESGKSVNMPIVHGKKMAYAKILAERKETLALNGQQIATMQYEAFIFDNVIFRRKGLLLIWISEDAAHLPVQMQFQMGFPIGNITLSLEKDDHR